MPTEIDALLADASAAVYNRRHKYFMECSKYFFYVNYNQSIKKNIEKIKELIGI